MKLKDYLCSNSSIGASALSRLLGVSTSFVYQWKTERRPIPVEYCAGLERATNGAVTRKDLRPNDWHQIWPELAASISEPEDAKARGEAGRGCLRASDGKREG